jgi:WD40 repeat protein
VAKINRSLAIIIGIDQYTHIPKLKNAVSDATELANVLKNNYNYEVLLLLDQKATKEKFDELLANLEKKTIQFDNQSIQVEKTDRVLFYFAGHGFAEEAQDSEDRKPAGYFMPQNAEFGNSKTWLSMQKLYEVFTSLDCHHLLMILDCCFAGRISWVGKGRNAARSRKLYKQSYERFTKNRTQQIITSAAHDEEAQDVSRFVQRGEKNGSKHSPFAYHLLNVLRGNSRNDDERDSIKEIVKDKLITAQELFTYLQTQLAKEKKEQTPGLLQSRMEKDGQYVLLKGEYIFLIGDFNPEKLEILKLDENTNPYKGLASYEKEDEDLFYGRKRLIEDPKEGLLSKVSNHPFTIVLGLSGSGKSSLVKAGLIPALKPEDWYVLNPMRPGESPLTALAEAILPMRENIDLSSLIKELQKNDRCLTESVKRWSEKNPNIKLLLTIDQSEELITLCRNDQEREDFLHLLAKALASKELSERLHIVLTLRSEFEPQIRDAIKETHWQNAWQDGRFIVTPMDREELQQAIEEPAAQRALFFESPKLVNDLIDEVVQMPGALPLLSFTLSELYLKYLKAEEKGERNDRTITEADYQEIGGVTRSLTQTADKTYNKLVNEEKVDESTIRDVMLRMVAISGGELARRRVPTSELEYPGQKNERAKKVIDRFYEARLLVKPFDTENKECVEPAHDALVRGWSLLKNWIGEIVAEENLSLEQRLRMNAAANDWHKNRNLENNKNQKDIEEERGYLWHDNAYLPLLEKLKESGNWLNQLELNFVEASVDEHDRQARERLEKEIELNTTECKMLFTANDRLYAIAKMIETGKKLQKEPKITEYKELDFLITFNQLLSECGEINSIEVGDPVNNFSCNQIAEVIATVSGQFDKLCFWDWPGNLINCEQNQERFCDLAFSPDGEILVTGGKDGLIKFYKREPNGCYIFHKTQDDTKKHDGIVSCVKFSPDGTFLISVGFDRNIIFWEREGKYLATIFHGHNVEDIVFSPKDKLIAFASQDRETDKRSIVIKEYQVYEEKSDQAGSSKGIHLFDFDEFDAEHKGEISAIDFSPDGKTLVSVGEDGILRIWFITKNMSKDYSKIRNCLFTDAEASISSVAFSPNRRIVASSHTNGIINIWDTSITESSHELQKLYKLAGHKKEITRISFTFDGSQLLSSSNDGTLKFWSFTDRFEGRTREEVQKVSFSRDNQIITTVDWDGRLLFWQSTGEPIEMPIDNKINHKSEFCDVQLSRDNEIVVAVARDGEIEVKLYSYNGEILNGSINKYEQTINSLNFSPKEDIFVTTSNDNTISLWRVNRDPLNIELWKTLTDYSEKITAITFSDDGKFFASGSDDGTIKLWKLEDTQVLESMSDSEGSIVDNDSNDNWCKKTTGKIYALKFYDDNKIIISINKFGSLAIWSIDGSSPLKEINLLANQALDIEVESAVFSSNGKEVVLVTYLKERDYDSYRKIQTYNLDIETLIANACNRIQNYLQLNNIKFEDARS